MTDQTPRNLPALAAQSELCSRRLQALKDAGLEPASPTRAMVELGACLALVGSSGMPEANRAEWLKVAHMTLADVPADLLARGCEKARRTCQFPSQIVPTIIEEIEIAMELRRDRVKREPTSFIPPPREPEPEYVDPKEIQKLIKRIGGSSGN